MVAAEEQDKKRRIAEELLEEARHPAYAADIQDCQTLIDYFSVKTGSSEATTSSGYVRPAVAGAPALEIRQVDTDLKGMVARKKKGEDEENYFVAKKTVKPVTAKKTAPTPPPQTKAAPSAASTQLQIPFGTLSGLLALSIPPPVSTEDIPRVIEDLKTKKAWFQANRTSLSLIYLCLSLIIVLQRPASRKKTLQRQKRRLPSSTRPRQRQMVLPRKRRQMQLLMQMRHPQLRSLSSLLPFLSKMRHTIRVQLRVLAL